MVLEGDMGGGALDETCGVAARGGAPKEDGPAHGLHFAAFATLKAVHRRDIELVDAKSVGGPVSRDRHFFLGGGVDDGELALHHHLCS